MTLVTGLTRIADAGMGASSSPELSLMHAYFAYGIGALFLSVLAMKLRKGGNSLVAPACAGVKAGFVRTLHPIRTAT